MSFRVLSPQTPLLIVTRIESSAKDLAAEIPVQKRPQVGRPLGRETLSKADVERGPLYRTLAHCNATKAISDGMGKKKLKLVCALQEVTWKLR